MKKEYFYYKNEMQPERFAEWMIMFFGMYPDKNKIGILTDRLNEMFVESKIEGNDE